MKAPRRLASGCSRFAFLIVSVACGFTLAGAGSVAFGVPLALAAFVGGLAVAESPESEEARRRLLPFRDLLAVLFFVAIGTLVDPWSMTDLPAPAASSAANAMFLARGR